MHCLPFESAAIVAYPTKASWDAQSAELVKTMLDRWHLRALHPLGEGFAAAAMEVVTDSGESAVLKVGFPHPEAAWEAVALEAMGPTLAPTVLRQDPWTWAMLLSEITPGSDLHTLSVDEALAVAGRVMVRLAQIEPPVGMPTLVDSVREFVAGARGRRSTQWSMLDELGGTDRVDAAFEVADALCEIPSDAGFVHGDLNPTNMLLDAERGWLAIDPKPMVGDRAYDAWPFVRQLGRSGQGGMSAEECTRRVRIVAGFTGLVERRLVEWSLVRSALALTWYIDDRLVRQAEREAATLAVLEAVLEATESPAAG